MGRGNSREWRWTANWQPTSAYLVYAGRSARVANVVGALWAARRPRVRILRPVQIGAGHVQQADLLHHVDDDQSLLGAVRHAEGNQTDDNAVGSTTWSVLSLKAHCIVRTVRSWSSLSTRLSGPDTRSACTAAGRSVAPENRAACAADPVGRAACRHSTHGKMTEVLRRGHAQSNSRTERALTFLSPSLGSLFGSDRGKNSHSASASSGFS